MIVLGGLIFFWKCKHQLQMSPNKLKHNSLQYKQFFTLYDIYLFWLWKATFRLLMRSSKTCLQQYEPINSVIRIGQTEQPNLTCFFSCRPDKDVNAGGIGLNIQLELVDCGPVSLFVGTASKQWPAIVTFALPFLFRWCRGAWSWVRGCQRWRPAWLKWRWWC